MHEVHPVRTKSNDESSKINLTHLHTQSIIPKSLNVQVFTVYMVSMEQGFFFYWERKRTTGYKL